MKIEKPCEYCGKVTLREKSQVDAGRHKYCNRKCFGLARRLNRSDGEKKALKREYDKQYRANHREILKDKKADWFQKTYDPKKAAIERKKTMPRHVLYCQSPEYRKKKKAYDKIHRAKKYYGEFWETCIALVELQRVIRSQISMYESRKERGLLNKTLERSRNGTVKRSYT